MAIGDLDDLRRDAARAEQQETVTEQRRAEHRRAQELVQLRCAALEVGREAAIARAQELWAPLRVAADVIAGGRALLWVEGFPSAHGETWDEAFAAALAGPLSLERTLPARFYAEPSPQRAGALALEITGSFLGGVDGALPSMATVCTEARKLLPIWAAARSLVKAGA